MDSKGSIDSYRMPDAMREKIRAILRAYRTGSGARPRKNCDALRTRFYNDCELGIGGRLSLHAWLLGAPLTLNSRNGTGS